MTREESNPAVLSAGVATEVPDVASSEMERHIGLSSVILLVIGNVIGSGIFLTSGVMLQHMPSSSLLILAWIAGGVLVLAGALTYAEMGAMFPQAGGLYLFLHEAYGPLLAFLFGWASLLVILTGQIGAIAIGFSEYFSYFFPFFSSNHVLFAIPLAGHHTLVFTANKVTAAVAIALLGAVNYVDARKSNHLNAALTLAKIAGICALPILAVFFGRVHPQWVPIIPPHMTGAASAFGVAMIAVLWAYDGWQYVPFAAGEIENAQKNLPRALIVGVFLVIVIFVTVNLAYLYALPTRQMQGLIRVGEASATALAGPMEGRFISLAVLFSTFGCCAAMMLVCTRLFFAMARKGVFPRSIGRIHPRYGTPHAAIVLTTIWAILYALSGSYEQLFTYVMFGGLLFAVLGGMALFVLRHKLPGQARPYRVWGYPVVPCIFIAGTWLLVFNTVLKKPFESFAGLALILVGLPAYWYWHGAAHLKKND
jgi:APA family basic amino acid/polyamine antiporter